MSSSQTSATSSPAQRAKGSPNIEDIYPLSPLQQGILFHCLYAPKSVAYFMQTSWALQGDMQVEAFRRAWQQVMDRHPVLRTRFVWERREQPLQVLHRKVELPWEYLDWGELSEAEQHEHLEAYLAADQQRGFRLDQAPLMRIALIRMGEQSYQLIWTHHHLLLDGWCLPLILQDFFTLYEAACSRRYVALAPPRPYRDYIVWLQQQDQARAETFWREYLGGFSTPTPVAIDQAPGSLLGENPAYNEQHISLDARTTSALEALARGHQLTLNTLVQGAWAYLLQLYSGERDVLFGITVAGRPAEIEGVETMVGLFINALPLRVQLPPEDTLVPWLKRLQAQQIEARQYEYCSLVQVQGWSAVPRGTSLFESLLVFQNFAGASEDNRVQQRLTIGDVHSLERTNYPLTLVAQPGDELRFTLVYDCDRFDDAAIGRMLGHLGTVLAGMAADPAQRLADIPFLTEAERQELVVARNATAAAYPATACYHQLVEAQVARTPEAVAVQFMDQRLTYRELDRRANQLAHDLRGRGVGPGDVVALCLERSLDMPVALLGIWKAGAAFLPLDPSFPHERMAFMLHDTQAGLLLTQARLRPQLAGLDATLICLDEDWPSIAAHPADAPPESAVTAEHLAYVIYTSGSTGRPKGVMIPHRGLVNYLYWALEAYGAANGRGAPVQSSIAADAIFPSLFAPLMVGTTVVLLPGTEAVEGLEALAAALQEHRPFSLVKITPTQLEALNQLLPHTSSNDWVRTLVVGAEALRGDTVQFWQTHQPETILLNEYGPTETVVGCSIYHVPSATSLSGAVPIGLPIANLQFYVLDAQMQPLPIGVPGELYIGGDGVAWGYQNRPDLTAEKFIPNPFAENKEQRTKNKEPRTENQEPQRSAVGGRWSVVGGRLYKTGDLVRYLPDRAANIEFLGRIDDQVKIRGYRVELGEIEATLIEHPAVREIVVLAREGMGGGKQLVAYVVPSQEQRTTQRVPDQEQTSEESYSQFSILNSQFSQELRAFLEERLPDYMIPEAFLFLEALPLTPHGKLNRHALPAPGRIQQQAGVFVAPRSPVEATLADIWQKVLRVERVGIHDNFFSLGGHSLLVIQVVSRVREHLRIELPLRAVFEAPTVAQLALALAKHETPEGAARSQAPLVAIKPAGTRPPFFAVHPAGGEVLCYFELAQHLDAEQPLYGLQAAGLYSNQTPDTSVEQIAARYVAAVRQQQPSGPYFLGGWSLGGVIAFEIARQLRQQGETVALLALLDTRLPQAGAAEPDQFELMLSFALEFGLEPQALTELGDKLETQPADQWLAATLEYLRQAGIVTYDIDPGTMQRRFQVFAANLRALHSYTPQAYDGRVTLISAQDRLGGAATDSDPGWDTLALGGVTIAEAPGSHYTMIRRPYAPALAALLQEQLRGA